MHSKLALFVAVSENGMKFDESVKGAYTGLTTYLVAVQMVNYTLISKRRLVSDL